MPKLPPKSELTKVEEGQIIERADPLFDYFVITSRQLDAFAEAAQRVTNVYSQLSEGLFGPAKALIQAQEKIANSLLNLSQQLAKFNQINFVVPIPRLGYYNFPQPPALPIYIQPDKPYVPTKELSSGEKKQQLPLTAIKIEGKGFTIEGEYIKGMTVDSKPGKLLQLMLREDLQGVITDELISKAVGIRSSDYRAWGFVMRDLKEILIEKKKLKLDMERYKGIEQYKISGLTKYLRRPRKAKKTNSTDKVN